MHLSNQQLIFDHIFYGIADVVFLVLSIMAVRIVRGTRWRAALSWIMPYLWSDALQLVYRILLNLHYFLGLPISDRVYVLMRSSSYIWDALSLYGTVLLLRFLRQLVDGTLPEIHIGKPEAMIEEGVWPPPPSK